MGGSILEKFSVKALAQVLVLAFATTAFAAQGEYAPGEVIVKYRNGVQRGRSMMNTVYDAAGVQRIRRFTGNMTGIEQIFLRDNVKVEDAVAAFLKSDAVEYAQPNYILRLPTRVAQPQQDPPFPIPCIPGFEIPGCDPNAKLPCLIPGLPFPPGCEDSGGGGGGGGNQPPAQRPELQPAPAETLPPVADPDLAKAYGLSKIGATIAWESHKGSKDFVVAVIDTGVDYNHQDLSFNMWRNPNPSDKNDVVGFDFVHNDGLPFDDNEHGTHTSGTVGAVGGNGVGVSGVNQRVSIMGLKFLSGEGSGTTADAIRAIDYAINHGAKVLSNSWGGGYDPDNQALYDAIVRAMNKDVLFVAAAGNDGADNDGSKASYPAAFKVENLIAVAASDDKDGLAFFSNYGATTVHLAAPGVNVYSTTPGNKYASHSGTSMACPHVAGAAALLWSKHPDWNFKQVKAALLNSVDVIPAFAGKMTTGGRLNVLKALSSKE